MKNAREEWKKDFACKHTDEFTKLSILHGQSYLDNLPIHTGSMVIMNQQLPSHYRHHGIKIFLKSISAEEWTKGVLSKSTITKLKNSIAESQRTVNAELEKAKAVNKNGLTADEKNNLTKQIRDLKTQMEQLSFPICKNIWTMIVHWKNKTLKKQFVTRSRKPAICISNTEASLLFHDYLNGKRLEDSEIIKNPKNIRRLFCEAHSIFVAQTNTDVKTKIARAIIRQMRKFEKKNKTGGVVVYGYGIADIRGPIRQQKHIIKAVLDWSNSNKRQLWLSPELRHRFRCDLEFEEKPIKIITDYFITNFDGKPEKLLTFGMEPLIAEAKISRKGSSYCLIPEAYEVMGLLKPKTK